MIHNCDWHRKNNIPFHGANDCDQHSHTTLTETTSSRPTPLPLTGNKAAIVL